MTSLPKSQTIFIFTLILIFLIAFLYKNPLISPLSLTDDSQTCKDCNLIIISLTNSGAKHFSTYGYQYETTPNIDEFGKGSMVFENAFSHASWTLPSGTSFFTSLFPFSHKVMERYSGEILDRDIITLADILNSEGYRTAAFTGGFDYDIRYDVINRFGEIKNLDKGEHFSFRKLAATIEIYGDLPLTVPAATEWLERNSGKKFFIFVQGYDSHCPFTPPEPYNDMFDPDYKGNVDFSSCFFTYDKTEPVMIEGKKTYFAHTSYYDAETEKFVVKNTSLNEDDIRHMIALHDSEIRYADSLVGKLLDKIEELDLSDNTMIVVFSEHGDMLGKQGRFMRGGPLKGTFFDDVLNVPLIIKHPNLESKRIDGLVQLIDVMPTLLEFLGIKTNAKIQGRSLLPLIFKNETINELVFAGVKFTPPEYNLFFQKPTVITSVRSYDWKLIREMVLTQDKLSIESVNYELYNLKEDPEELNNVFGRHKKIELSLNQSINSRFGHIISNKN